MEQALSAISGRWTTLVLRELLSHGPLPFTALARRLPALSDEVLTDRLSALVASGLVERQLTSGFPARSQYRISERGLLLRPLLVQLYRTGAALLAHRSE